MRASEIVGGGQEHSLPLCAKNCSSDKPREGRQRMIVGERERLVRHPKGLLPESVVGGARPVMTQSSMADHNHVASLAEECG